MPLPIRYSPSGAVIATLAAGARLRLAELESPMAGSAAVPTSKSVICSDGFGGAAPLICTLLLPKPNLKYRAELRLDVWNITTNVGGQVAIFIETSRDGVNFTSNRAQNAHIVQAQLGDSSEENGQARQLSLVMPLISGADLGVVDGDASLKVRFLAMTTIGGATTMQVNSPSAATGLDGVTLNGNIYGSLEECLGD